MPTPHHLRRQQLLALKKQTCLSTSSDNIFSFLHVQQQQQQQLENYLRPVLSTYRLIYEIFYLGESVFTVAKLPGIFHVVHVSLPYAHSSFPVEPVSKDPIVSN
jgi:hypothetical protein